jgi:hypothetical protein
MDMFRPYEEQNVIHRHHAHKPSIRIRHHHAEDAPLLSLSCFPETFGRFRYGQIRTQRMKIPSHNIFGGKHPDTSSATELIA